MYSSDPCNAFGRWGRAPRFSRKLSDAPNLDLEYQGRLPPAVVGGRCSRVAMGRACSQQAVAEGRRCGPLAVVAAWGGLLDAACTEGCWAGCPRCYLSVIAAASRARNWLGRKPRRAKAEQSVAQRSGMAVLAAMQQDRRSRVRHRAGAAPPGEAMPDCVSGAAAWGDCGHPYHRALPSAPSPASHSAPDL